MTWWSYYHQNILITLNESSPLAIVAMMMTINKEKGVALVVLHNTTILPLSHHCQNSLHRHFHRHDYSWSSILSPSPSLLSMHHVFLLLKIVNHDHHDHHQWAQYQPMITRVSTISHKNPTTWFTDNPIWFSIRGEQIFLMNNKEHNLCRSNASQTKNAEPFFAFVVVVN